MNIKAAKNEIVNTVRAYLAKDATGAYEIPTERQRPILLMGAPGIGKTAIMEQVARECKINLVAYTITHHTRQSAIGLPFISQKDFDGTKHSVTEYTMSEIIASVYEQIERSGVREGILFLDEINCVSETMAPTMLQFLQYKTFGNHKLPEGFLIVTAGNPPQYNSSVRDFDIVTLDRVKRIFVEEDYGVWKEYAYRIGIHGSILSYLEIRKDHFYLVKADLAGKRFVTARGWEDLSRIICVYEKLNIPVNYDLVIQYLQDEDVAKSFADYYELYNKYKNIYKVEDLIIGNYPEDTLKLEKAPFDEKLSMIGLMVQRLNQDFTEYAFGYDAAKIVFEQLKILRQSLKEEKKPAHLLLKRQLEAKSLIEEKNKESGMSSREEQKIWYMAKQRLQKYEDMLATNFVDAPESFSMVKRAFEAEEEERGKQITLADTHLTNAFQFFVNTYGEGQELVIFLSELSAGYYSLRFVSECGSDAYYKYNRLLLLRERKEDLKAEVLQFINE